MKTVKCFICRRELEKEEVEEIKRRKIEVFLKAMWEDWEGISALLREIFEKEP